MDELQPHQGGRRARRDPAGHRRHDRPGRRQRGQERSTNVLEITGVMLTKLDGDTRGGAAFRVKAVTGKPIKFAGAGEKLDDLEPFYPERMACRILGMGDVLTLHRKGPEAVRRQSRRKTARGAVPEEQVRHERHAGPAPPDAKNGRPARPCSCACSPGHWKQARMWTTWTTARWTTVQAIIHSMTPAERAKPKLINPKPQAPHRRRQRHAGGGCEPAAASSSSHDAKADEAGEAQPGKGFGTPFCSGNSAGLETLDGKAPVRPAGSSRAGRARRIASNKVNVIVCRR